MPNPLVIYHDGCPDGTAAAWATWTVFGAAATYLPATYGSEPPPVVNPTTNEPRDVVIVDFSYQRVALVRMAEEARSIIVLDHHKTARESCEGLSFCIFDMERSGAGLAWDHFRPDAPRPWLINYTEDRDLWRHALPNTREVNAWLRSQPRTIEGYDLASATSLDVARAIGAEILAAERVYIESVKARASLAVLAGHVVPVVECGRHCASEIVGELSEAYPFAASWELRDGAVCYSLRSRGDGLDVSTVARQFGGGGHRNAAGFSSPSPVHVGCATESSESFRQTSVVVP